MQRVLVSLVLVALMVGFGAQWVTPVGAASHSISISPSSGSPKSTSIQVNGSGFTASESVTVIYDGITQLTLSANGTGGFSQSFTVPASTGGIKIVSAVAPSGNATANFNVQPSVNLSPSQGSGGDTVSVTGEGFGGSQSNVSITFDGDSVQPGSTNSNGTLSASFTVPSVAAGTYTVNVGGVNKTFTLSSSFSVSPSSGPPGTSVLISGSGYTPNSSVSLTIGGSPLQTLQTDSSGNLSGTVAIPSLSGGSKTIQASGGGSSNSQKTFNITSTLILDQPTAAPGSTVNVTGNAFRSNEGGITVKFDSTSVASNITADSQGIWNASFQVPASTAGDHNVTASGNSGSTSSTRLTVGAGISLGRSSGPPGTILKINGSGARSNERILINISDGLARAETSANSSGVWSTNITIPPAPRGTLDIDVNGSNNQTTTSIFNVTSDLSISTPTGAPGSTVVLSGEGYGANESGINISFDNAIVTSTSADTRGSWSVNLVIPPAPKGTYVIKTSGAGGNLQTQFTVAAGLSINKPQASPGDSVTVSGSGFAPNETGITLKMGETTIANGLNANASGSWNTSFAIPPLPANSYELSASGALTSSGSIQKQTLTLLTHVAINSTSGHPGTTLALSGKGFGAGEQNITVSYDGTVVLSGLTSDARGAFTTSFVVPPSTAGQHSIVVSGSSGVGLGSELSFQVTPGLILAETSGPSGQTMQLAGAGFGPNEQNIEIKFGSQPVLTGISTDLNGEFEASFPLPRAAAGQHILSASGPGGSLSSQAQLTYTVVPHISLSDSVGNVGMNLAVAGTGFTPSSSVTLAYDDLTETKVISDAAGSFELQITVPESPKGIHSLIALDESGNQIREAFEIESIPPTPPALRTPGNGDSGGLFGKFRPTIKWSPVEDASGVTYNVQIAADQDFQDVLVDRKGLSSPSYKLTKEEALPRGTYYWRVQAVDLASNASAHSTVFEMNSGIIPVWLMSAMIGLGIIASGGGVYAYYTRVYLPRRTAHEAPVYPDFVRISRPEISAPAQSTTSTAPTPALTAPRRALPSPFRRGGGASTGRSSVTPEQQAHLQMVVDFVRSIPLLEVSPDLIWIDELIESLGGEPGDMFDQVLRGDLEPVYQPPWMQHPTYQEMQSEPAASVFLEGLEVYIEAVNDCASETFSILRRVYNEVDTAGPLNAPALQQWRYALTITQSTIAWFRGTYLGQPSAREYTILAGGDPADASLNGVDGSPFSGVIIEGLNEEDLVFYRDLHIQLRNTYRVDEDARALAAKMSSTSALRDQLRHNITQMGDTSQSR